MTALPAPVEARLLPAPEHPRATVDWWGMAWFCATEATLFACLLASYFYLGVSNPRWPPAGIPDPKLQLPLVMTVLLVSSSVVIHWGEKALTSGGRARFRAALAVTMLLGLGFLSLQALEYADKLKHESPSGHAYTALFFATTGLHGAHVAFGLLMWAYVGLRELLGHFDARHHVAVKNVSLYWHTVDAIWLAILAVLYLSPRLY